MTARTGEPTLLELYTPKLVTVLRERYGLGDKGRDAARLSDGQGEDAPSTPV